MAQSDSKKVLEYEHFLNNKLREDLRVTLENRNKILFDIAEYLELKTFVEKLLINNDEKITTKLDLGCNFYAQAVVKDTKKIFISIGFGFFLEMTPEEALKFIDEKCTYLNEQSDLLSKQCISIKARIKLVLEGLRELQNIK
ncbi:DgyrCDS4858 [Dimorphilus gyrociliatus]|uniref:DgyrCDS4858 n=1 Tax=Dimorphilus gyrociliatus TaxID=2664684 RepID=A0A7I8VJP2_9ANNE|nr:DgyrCDS4858 [Dimorphilus gyrociliatus]